MEHTFAKKEQKAAKVAVCNSDKPLLSGEREIAVRAGLPLFLQARFQVAASAPPIAPLPRIQRQMEDEEEEEELLQPKFDAHAEYAVGSADDPLEREADHVADRVRRLPDGNNRLQPLCAECGERRRESKPILLSRKVECQSGGKVGGSVAKTVRSPGAGAPMSLSVQALLSQVLNSDLSHVRIHNDTRAQQAAKTIQAKAFTHQNHIFLATGQSGEDTELMAHEATHVVQQSRDSGIQKIQRRPEATIPTPASYPEIGEIADAASPQSSAASDNVIGEEEDPAADLGHLSDEVDEVQDIDAGESESEAPTSEEEAAQEGEVGATAEENAETGEESAAESRSGEGLGGGEEAEADSLLETAGETDLSELSTGDIALIDVELAEHQRWAAAGARVGQEGSVERAEFIAEAAGGGMLSGLASGAAMGLAMGLVGRAAARFVPIPGVGAILAGGMSAYGLATRDWGKTGETISNFGQGSSDYETLANSIAAISEIIDVVTNVLNVVAGIIGLISAAMWIITVVTVGVASPLAATLSSIALGIVAVTGILDAINAGILQPCVGLFRALHTFTSEADPREVEAQGSGIAEAAAASGAALGAFAGGKAAEIGGGGPARGDTDAEAPHNSPEADAPVSAASGDGPTVHYEAAAVDADAPTTAGREVPPGFEDAPGWIQHMASSDTPQAERMANAPEWVQRLASPDAGPQWMQRLAARSDRFRGVETQRSVSPESSALESAEVAPIEGTQQGVVPAEIDTPPSNYVPPPEGFVPEEPVLHQNWLYNEPVPGRDNLGQNVQRDHVIAQAKMRDMMGPDYDIRAQAEAPAMTPEGQLGFVGIDIEPGQARNYATTSRGGSAPGTQVAPESAGNWGQIQGYVDKPLDINNLPPGYGVRRDSNNNVIALPRTRGTANDTNVAPLHVDDQGIVRAGHRTSGGTPEYISHVQGSLTVLAETGAISETQAHPHTQATFRDPQADVSEINRLRSQGGPDSHSSDLIDPSVEARMRSGYQDEQALHRGWLDQMGRAFQTRRMGEHSYVPLEDANGMPILDSSGQPRLVPLVDAEGRPVESVAERLAELQGQRGEPVEDIPDIDEMNWSDFEDQSVLPPLQTPIEVASPPATSSTMIPGTDPSSAEAPFTASYQAARNAERARNTSGATGTLAQVGQLLLPQFFGPGGAPPSREQVHAAHNARFTADNRADVPGVERVNPHYPPPPGTPQQLEAIQQEIENILAARARAEQAEQRMGREEAATQANQGPIQESVQEMGGAVTATQAHQAAVASRQQANQAQQQRQQESQGLIAGAPSRLAGLTALTVPLTAFERFSHYASVIPDPAGARMAQMNRDSQRMLGAFAEITVAMATQNEEQPARREALANDSDRLGSTSEQATRSQDNFQQASDGAQALQAANNEQLVQAGQAREEAAQQGSELDEAATTKQNQARTLSEQLQAWAQAHRAARRTAVEQTQARLREEGYEITAVSGE